MLLPYLTTFTVQSYLVTLITTFRAVSKPNICAVIKDQTTYFLYIEFNIFFVKSFYLASFDAYSHKYSM
jgi:hypothetical protein